MTCGYTTNFKIQKQFWKTSKRVFRVTLLSVNDLVGINGRPALFLFLYILYNFVYGGKHSLLYAPLISYCYSESKQITGFKCMSGQKNTLKLLFYSNAIPL